MERRISSIYRFYFILMGPFASRSTPVAIAGFKVRRFKLVHELRAISIFGESMPVMVVTPSTLGYSVIRSVTPQGTTTLCALGEPSLISTQPGSTNTQRIMSKCPHVRCG